MVPDRELPPQARLFVDVDATSVTCAALNRIGDPIPEARPQLCGIEPDRFRRLVLIGVALNRIGDPLRRFTLKEEWYQTTPRMA